MDNIKYNITVIGKGGHSKTVCSAIESMKFYNINILDNDTLLDNSEDVVVIAIGDNKTRNRIACNIKNTASVVVDLESHIDNQVKLDGGTVVLKGATIQRDTTIGKHCIINTNASVDHDCKIGDFVHIAPNATLCGSVIVGNNTLVGAGAVVIPGVTIGKNCIIGAGTVVLANVKDNQTVVGKHG
tara:strand:+ start:181 stop:735 length:555 start_codon:yes stop_codon:yes gene_type:complete